MSTQSNRPQDQATSDPLVPTALPVRREMPDGSFDAPSSLSARLERLEPRMMLSGNFPQASDNDLAYDPSGNLHVAYYDAAAKNLKSVTQTPGGQWSQPVTIDSSSADVGKFVALAIDNAGRP